MIIAFENVYCPRSSAKIILSSPALEEKLDIANKGRPTPPLPNLVQQYKTNRRTLDAKGMELLLAGKCNLLNLHVS